MTDKDDYDSPWKEIIEYYFPEFIDFFFPKADKDIDWKRGYEFLDKEFQKITKDAEDTRRYVDKLAKVWLKNGTEEWAVIHADIQGQWEKDFSERMYIYNYRLYDRYRRHVASFAVLGDTGSIWKPDTFERSVWDCEIRFKFPVVKLNDYRKNTAELEKSSNPFAVVVLAHLKTQETAGDKIKRRNEKLAIVRGLYQKGYSKQDIINLFRFIDWIMFLPEKEEELFWQELDSYEKEEKMPYITSVERIGYKRGEKIGYARGEKTGYARGEKTGYEKGGIFILAKQIAAKYKADMENELTYLAGLNSDDIAELSVLILDFESLDEVHEWIDEQVVKKEAVL